MIRIRAVNSMGAVGPWTYLAHTVDGPTSVGTPEIVPDAVTAVSTGTHNASISIGSAVAYDSGFPPTDVLTITSTGKPTKVSGVATADITLGSTSVANLGFNLLIYRNGTSIHNKNKNGPVATLSSVQTLATIFPFDILDTPPAGSVTYSYRWVVNWVNASSSGVTVSSVSGSRSIEMSAQENKAST